MKEQDEKATAQLMTEQDNEDPNNVSKMGGKVQKAIKSKINSFSAICSKMISDLTSVQTTQQRYNHAVVQYKMNLSTLYLSFSICHF